MALLQRQCEKNSSTSSLSPSNDFYSKSFANTMQNIALDMSICLEKSEELCASTNSFCKQYKNQQIEIKNLQDLLRNNRKKQGFKKNHEQPIIQQTPQHRNSYSFSPTIIFR